MPLLPGILTGEILKITDKNNGSFVGFPAVIVGGVLDVAATNTQVATNWANAVAAYFQLITNPIVLPPIQQLARTAFIPAMAGVMGPPGSPTGAAALGAGLAAFTAVFTAAAPFVVIPPPTLFVPPPLPPTPDPLLPALSLAAAIDAWARTGTASIPPAPPVPWV